MTLLAPVLKNSKITCILEVDSHNNLIIFGEKNLSVMGSFIMQCLENYLAKSIK